MSERSDTVTSPADHRESLKTLPRRRFFSDMPDKGLFAVVAMVGFVGIIVFKLRDFDADYIAAGAVALMVGYGMVAYRLPMVQIRVDRLGDNFYYLGFIYTLASLSAALLQLRSNIPIETLLGSFGIALFTTIVGVAGRVLFAQMRGELDDVEEKVRRNLLEVSADLQAQLNIALREFQTFHTGVLQTAKETLSNAIDQSNREIERIGVAAKGAADDIEGAFGATTSHVRRLSEAVKEVSSATNEFRDRLGELELPNRRLEQQLSVFGEHLQSLMIRLRAIIEGIEHSKRQRKLLWYWPFGRR